MDIIAGTQATLAKDTMNDLARFRYRVFVEMLGWDLPCRDGLELDQFDREDTVYLVAHKDEQVVGTARLLPTHLPYLLGEVFPQLMGQQPLPQDPAIWELSRFTAVDLDAMRGGGPRASSHRPLRWNCCARSSGSPPSAGFSASSRSRPWASSDCCAGPASWPTAQVRP